MAPTRRTVLAAGGTLLTGLAGCGRSGSEASTDERVTGGDGPTTTDPTADLDLREANVTAVELAAESDGRYRFDVTLYHDDDGEDGYANWWQVETLDGEQLGRRDLLHAHSTAPFTRSETVTVPEDVGCVAVRGHDETHGYGGQAMLVRVPGGETTPVRQGRERRQFDTEACP
ncbi:hypothetical protein [Haloarcula pellucida]|uniref:Lipoprotein n=1 Tax=Haloarcula pellucida TaxID=1427151 RepID=A0A830GJ85_9EURY|nr:hypothetical protein [Halomicroarcula pellucida]MBX0347695.1 hypothetical protein [Halomicroarcula pellucida]GGN89897.1 hypothetical protein GCM10009030_11200 [Halomicroarcula pellucida]